MRKVFHIRIDSAPGYRSNAIEKGFLENGFEYYGFSWQEYRFNHGLEQMRKEAVRLAAEIKPTIIFAHIQNSEAFDLDTWKELASIAFTINYTFDVRGASKMRWMYETAPHIGHTFFASQDDVANCRVRGVLNATHMHSSCDMDLFKPNGRRLYAFDIVFCGNKYENTNLDFPFAEERQRMIEFLEQRYQSRFMVYGLGQKGGLIPPETEANVYNFSRIAICQNNFNLTEYSSDRLWRIMSSGALCLTKHFDGIQKTFKKEVHLDWWNDFTELKELIDYYLSDEKERLAVAECGTNYVRENHSWVNRISEMMSICEPQLVMA